LACDTLIKLIVLCIVYFLIKLNLTSYQLTLHQTGCPARCRRGPSNRRTTSQRRRHPEPVGDTVVWRCLEKNKGIKF